MDVERSAMSGMIQAPRKKNPAGQAEETTERGGERRTNEKEIASETERDGGRIRGKEGEEGKINVGKM